MGVLSGFCNPSWSPDTDWGAASHARCRLTGCPCDCGHGRLAPTEVADFEAAGLVVPPSLGGPRYVGPSRIRVGATPRDYSWWEAAGQLRLLRNPPHPESHTWSVGPFSIPSQASTLPSKGTAWVGPADMTAEAMALAIRDGDPRVARIGGLP